MNVIHVSKYKRNDKVGIQCGGVEKFAYYLSKAVPDLKLISWSDYPGWINVKQPDYVCAAVLNEYLLENGIVDDSTIVIADGYWGTGLQGKVGRLISVVHGSYFGRWLQSQVYPWGEAVGMDHVFAQHDLWSDESVDVVCVSKDCADDLRRAGIDKDVEVIHHGIFLDIYRPPEERGELLMHGATSARKGADVIRALYDLFDIEVAPMNEFSGRMTREARRLGQAKMLIAPTRHEGNAYLLMEALACDVPLVTYTTGLACEMDDGCGEILDDISPYAVREAMRRLDRRYKVGMAREWAISHCDFDSFSKHWRSYCAYSG